MPIMSPSKPIHLYQHNGEPASKADIVALFPGTKLERTTFQHPFLQENGKARSVLGVTADYVTADQGTGAVHTAPAHGVDDFATGKRYDLPVPLWLFVFGTALFGSR